MSYATQSDVELACGGRQRLIELTDNENSGEVDSAVLAAKLSDVDSWIDSALHRRFSTPVAAPVPRALVQCAAEEAVYRLQLAHNSATVEAIEAHKDREEWLDMVAAGKRDLGLESAPQKSSAVKAQVVVRDSDEDVSRESLKGAIC